MNDEDYLEQYGIRPQQNRFETPEHISKDLLSIENYDSLFVNKDSVRANLNFNEMRGARAEGALILELEEGESLCNWDLHTSKKKTFGALGVLNGTSRGKNGWVSVLAKTDKHINIQAAEAYAGEIDAEFSDEVAQGMGSKIQSKLPFLKKKEM